MTKSSDKLEDKAMGEVDNKIAPTVQNKAVNTIEVTLKRGTYHKGVYHEAGSVITIEKSQLPSFN